MIFNHRAVFSFNGTMIDVSRIVNELGGDSYPFDFFAGTDYLYFGGDLPFTHRFIKLGDVANDEQSQISQIAIWDGKEWVEAVDIHDGTSVSDKTLARDGTISWTTERNSQWGKEATTEDMTGSGLETLRIYDQYWVRIALSNDLTQQLEMKYVGHRFSNDDDLGFQYPDLLLSATLNAFKSGKTDWVEQHVLAAEEVIRYLQRHNEMWSPNQILNPARFTEAALHKCAEIIYSSFSGEDMEVLRRRAQEKHRIALNQGVFNLDRNQNGHVEAVERKPNTGIFRA